MKKWLKRIRGAVGTALTWAAGWSVVGAIFWAVTVVLGGELTMAGFVVSGSVVAASFATAGFIGGAIFSTVLGLVEGRHRFDQMSLPRFAAWGALGGLLLSLFLIASGADRTRTSHRSWCRDASERGLRRCGRRRHRVDRRREARATREVRGDLLSSLGSEEGPTRC